jgi:hypothetical protein
VWYFENKDCHYRYDYERLCNELNELTSTGRSGDDDEAKQIIWTTGHDDLFFLLYFVLNIPALNHPWLVPKVYEAQDSYNKSLNLWSRETFKSTVLTFGLPIWLLINNWDESMCIFSFSHKIARGNFLRRIKRELESNELLKRVWPANTEKPGGFWMNPEKESPKWAETEGLMVQRSRGYNHPNQSIESYGVTEGMPTSAHYSKKIYDDLVTWDSTRTGDQIQKTKEGFDLTVPLGQTIGGEEWIVGTPYDFNDLYNTLEKSGNWNVRKYPADVQPSLWTEEQVEQKRREYSNPYNFSCQVSLNPIPNDKQKFLYNWIQWHNFDFPETNDYILVDPAGEKKAGSSYTVMWHLGVDAYKRINIKNIVRDKLNLKERWDKLSWLVGQASDPVVYYEKYSMQSDIEYIKEKQIEKKIFFEINSTGGSTSKDDRIRGMIPKFVEHKMIFPREYWYTDVEGKVRDLVKEFIDEEYIHFPNTTWKDMMDCLARIMDIELIYPNIKIEKPKPKTGFPWWIRPYGNTTWMAN